MVPAIVYFFIFNYVPMYGLTIVFRNFRFGLGIMGSPWVGLDNFRHVFGLARFYEVLRNSLTLSLMRLFFFFPTPIFLALAINEIPFLRFKKLLQTSIYLPFFISWVVIGGIIVNMLSPTWGIVNMAIRNMGGEPIFFLGTGNYFRWIITLSLIWKNAGWDTIIYLASITSISPELYEAATIDGASRFQRITNITLPGIKPTIVILLLLTIGSLMGNGFEQIFMFQNPANLHISEVFETYTFRLGLVNGRFSFAATVGMFSSVVGFILLITANTTAKLLGEKGIF